MADKHTLRSQFLAARQKIDRHTANAAAMAFARHLLDAVPASCPVLAIYQPILGEMDLAGALPELVERGHILCLPVVVQKGQTLVFRRWGLSDALIAGEYGIKTPAASAPEVIPDALIVPLVAFDAAGYRLGYGAGYYDQTIARLRASGKKLRTIGAAYTLQQVKQIPYEAHDERLDRVVTEEGIIVIPSAVEGSFSTQGDPSTLLRSAQDDRKVK